MLLFPGTTSSHFKYLTSNAFHYKWQVRRSQSGLRRPETPIVWAWLMETSGFAVISQQNLWCNQGPSCSHTSHIAAVFCYSKLTHGYFRSQYVELTIFWYTYGHWKTSYVVLKCLETAWLTRHNYWRLSEVIFWLFFLSFQSLKGHTDAMIGHLPSAFQHRKTPDFKVS